MTESVRREGKHWLIRIRAGGEGGIRTPDGLAPMPHFECGAFNRSATSPRAPFLARALDNGGPSRLQGQFAREIGTVFLLLGSFPATR